MSALRRFLRGVAERPQHNLLRADCRLVREHHHESRRAGLLVHNEVSRA